MKKKIIVHNKLTNSLKIFYRIYREILEKYS